MTNTEKIVDISVIVTINAGGRVSPLADLYEDYRRQLDKTGRSYEFLFVVEDDSGDAYRDLLDLHGSGKPIRVIKLSQSYGDSTNLTVGFDNSAGDTIVTLPAYHQVDPDTIPELIESLDDNDIVVVHRWPRLDGPINRLQTRIFHYVLRAGVGASYHDLGCAVRVLRRRVVETVHVYGHKHWFLPVLAARFGFKIREVKARQARSDSKTKYFRASIYVRRLLDLLSIFFLVKFTKKPLRFFGLTGLFMLVAGTVFTGFLTYQRLFMGVALADRPALLLGILLMVFGVQIFAIGLIGELIIFTHAKDLQDYTVEKIID